MKIDFRKNKHDKLIKRLTEEGVFYAGAIAEHVGVSEGMVRTRQKRIREETGFSVMDFRRGKNTQAQILIRKIDKMLGWTKAMQLSPMNYYSGINGKRKNK